MLLEKTLDKIAREAISGALGVEAPAALRATQERQHGDFQINGVLPLAKQLRRPPRELAQKVVDALSGHPALSGAEIGGPGFVNLRLSPTWVAAKLVDDLRDLRDGVPPVEKPERIVVDYSSPNVAKQMHVGHLRSTIIGDAIVRCLRMVGHHVIADNHIGDWGTQFGLLIVGMRRFGDARALEHDPITELERVYRLASDEAKRDPAFADAARADLAKLQAGDPENRALWTRFVETTKSALERVYERLGVGFDTWLGESAYDSMLPGIVDDLVQRGIARENQGAICVFFEDDPELGKNETPFIVRKKDGAFLYATTDIATLVHRRDEFSADRSVYVVDVRQQLHFKQLFAVAKKLGIPTRLDHVGFGTVLGPDGKPLKTREGQAVTLESLLDEAEERAAQRIREEGLEVAESDIPELARAVGIGAVKYADLRQNRLSDYQFDWDKMISFNGNAGPYLQYAGARIASIFRKGELDQSAITGPIELEQPSEIELGIRLLGFGDVVHDVAENYFPHVLCDHLYELARLFSAFYESCPVLKSEGATRESRLALCSLTSRKLRRGLNLLGITAVDRM
jgi:arginyl-tRNA synthetase